MTGSGRVNAYTYNYDENGIRTRKTIGNTVTDYYYNGSLLIGIAQTTTNSDGSTETSIQRFSYNADGRVIAETITAPIAIHMVIGNEAIRQREKSFLAQSIFAFSIGRRFRLSIVPLVSATK